MSKFKRQPKAGDLALKASKPFAIRPREFLANNFGAPVYRAPASEREPTVYPAGFKIKRFAAAKHRPNSGQSWLLKGGMSGGPEGSTRGVCSCNGSGVVPQAFMK